MVKTGFVMILSLAFASTSFDPIAHTQTGACNEAHPQHCDVVTCTQDGQDC